MVEPVYEFYLNGTQVFPNYSELNNVYEREAEEEFSRNGLKGNITFVGADYDLINSSGFTTRFTFLCKRKNEATQIFEDYAAAQFYKTDCVFDIDKRTIKPKLDFVDSYDQLFSNIENEYNLIKLAPEKVVMEFDKRPYLQIYLPFDNTIGCIMPGGYWEQPCKSVSATDAVNLYYFTETEATPEKKTLVITGTGIPSDIPGNYISNDLIFQEGSVFTSENGLYYIEVIRDIGVDPRYFYELKEVATDNILFKSSSNFGLDPLKAPNFEFYPEPGASGSYFSTYLFISVYTRYLTNESTFDGISTFDIPTDDIADNTANYEKVARFSFDEGQGAFTSATTTTTSTQYGIAPNGEYYDEPLAPDNSRPIPVARNSWTSLSIWFYISTQYISIDQTERSPASIKDASPISSAISVLLAKVAPTLTHQGTSAYSEFLYGTNPISGDTLRYFITQKTNITRGEYDEPAQKALIKLSEVLEMLKNVFRCYWFVDDTGKFRIEHIKYFRGGGSYSGAPELNEDLTTLKASNGLPWSKFSNEVSFLKDKLPGRYEFSWMDKSTEGFDGLPIIDNSGITQKGKIEEVKVGKFTTDLDYILATPAEVSNDGFVMFAAAPSGNNWKVSYGSRTVDNYNYILQNYFLAFIYLAPAFYIYDLPSYEVIINNEPGTVQGVKRSMIQEVKYPSVDDPDPLKLIRTELGDGNIAELSVNLHTRVNTITLKYDTYNV